MLLFQKNKRKITIDENELVKVNLSSRKMHQITIIPLFQQLKNEE